VGNVVEVDSSVAEVVTEYTVPMAEYTVPVLEYSDSSAANTKQGGSGSGRARKKKIPFDEIPVCIVQIYMSCLLLLYLPLFLENNLLYILI
jgi:hypothetical protein